MKKLVLFFALCCSFAVQAKDAELIGGSAEMQTRVMAVSAELRCLVCQGQSLADSNSDFAKDMREQILEMMENGRSDREVVDFMVDRYGDYVRYRPPFKATTFALWFGPFLLLAVGIAVLYYNVLSRRKQIQEVPLTEEERRRAEALLRGDTEKSSGEDK